MCLSRRLQGLVLLGLLLAACGGPGEDSSRAADAGQQDVEHATSEESAGGGQRLPDASEPSPGTVGADRDVGASTVPALAGFTVEQARATLEGFGAPVQVIAFEAEGTVTSTYPQTGEPVPPGEALVIWVGVPPDPPAPEPTPEPEPGPGDSPEEDDDDEAAEADDEAGASDADDGTEPSAELRPEGPQSSRTSPRRMPAAEPGEVLEGLASWYGPGFEGRTTACGGRYDSSEQTLATRELRCGTRVLVSHPSGATVEATATDWGPEEWTGRRFDLSRATFEAIAPLGRGVVTITVEVLD